jgi:hypothetical protein
MIGRLTTDALGPTYLEVEGDFTVDGERVRARFDKANALVIVEMAKYEAAQSGFGQLGMRLTEDGSAVESYEGDMVTATFRRDKDGMYPIGDTWGWKPVGASEASRWALRLTDAQWAAALADIDEDFGVRFVSDVDTVLTLAQQALGDREPGDPLACPALQDMAVWDTSDANNWTYMVTVDVAGFRLAGDHVEMKGLPDLPGPGPDRFKAVLGELISHRNILVRKLAQRFTATGVGATRDPDAGTVTLDIDTATGPLHIALTEEYGEAIGLLLLNDPAHSDGTEHLDD